MGTGAGFALGSSVGAATNKKPTESMPSLVADLMVDKVTVHGGGDVVKPLRSFFATHSG